MPKIKGGPGPLAVLFAGLEFGGRKLQGQTNLQAGVGTAASTAGGLGGAAAGAAIGTVHSSQEWERLSAVSSEG